MGDGSGKEEIKPISDTRFQRGVSRELGSISPYILPVLVNYQRKDCCITIIKKRSRGTNSRWQGARDWNVCKRERDRVNIKNRLVVARFE
jgi:hypothetical protein